MCWREAIAEITAENAKLHDPYSSGARIPDGCTACDYATPGYDRSK